MQRQPVVHHRYGTVAFAWYGSILFVAVAAGKWLDVESFAEVTLRAGLELAAIVIAALALVAPFVCGLALRRRGDPATGMTVSALAMLGHILLIAGPFVLATPFLARWMAIRRHESGGF